MSNQPKVSTSLTEDFESLGLPMDMGDTQRITGIEGQAPTEEAISKKKTESDCECEPDDDDCDCNEEGAVGSRMGPKDGSGPNDNCSKKEDVDEDEFDSEYVTKALFDRIEALPFDSMEKEDFEELLSQLSEKKIPYGDEDLMEQAERVVEGIGSRIRRFSAGKVSRKLSFQCPQGQRSTGVGNQCRPSHVVAGGMGNLNKESRRKKRWGRSGAGSVSKRRSARVNNRRSNMRGEGILSPFAQELLQVNESANDNGVVSVREDIVEHVMSILTFLNEEFQDKSVAEIYEESINTMIDTYEAGRLDEDVMNESEFIAELTPVISLITKSIEKLEDNELGNE